MKLNNFVGLLQMNKNLIILIATIIPFIIVLSFYLYFENSPKRKIIKFQKNVEELLKENKYKEAFVFIYSNKDINKLKISNEVKIKEYNNLITSMIDKLYFLYGGKINYGNYNLIYKTIIPIYSHASNQISQISEKEIYDKYKARKIINLFINKQYVYLQENVDEEINYLLDIEEYKFAYNRLYKNENLINAPNNIKFEIQKEEYINIINKAMNKLEKMSFNKIDTEKYKFIYQNILIAYENSMIKLNDIKNFYSINNRMNNIGIEISSDMRKINLRFNNIMKSIDLQRHKYLETLINNIDKMNNSKYTNELESKINEIYHYSKRYVAENRMPIMKYVNLDKDITKKSYHDLWEYIGKIYKRELKSYNIFIYNHFQN